MLAQVARRFFPHFEEPAQEARYREAHLVQTLPSVRRALIVSGLIESAFTVTDVGLNLDRPSVWKTLLMMRLFVWLPLLLTPLVGSYFPWGRRHLVTMIGVMVVVYFNTRGIVTFSTLPMALRIDTFFGLLVVVVLHYFILGLPIRVLYFTGLGLSVMYSLLAAAVGLPPHLIFMQSFIALVLGGACMFAAHQLEMSERRHFAANEALQAEQSERIRAERMASVATLVRGIAHELNNPIGFISGNVEPLRKYCDFLSRAALALSDGKPHAAEELGALTRYSAKKDLAFVAGDLGRIMDDIAEGARRSSLIISDLQNLTATGQRALESVDLHKAVAQTIALLNPRLTPNVHITAELESPQAPVIIARAGQLEQVLVILVDNAIRAVGERGAITVRVASEAGHVALTVSDDGPGMTPEVKHRALEPFFTTRPPGEGSGLGLAIAATIVRDHKGTLVLDSEPGKGTQVRIRLPLHSTH